jgi:TolA-binding protein
LVLSLLALGVGLSAAPVAAQSFRCEGVEFNAARIVNAPKGNHSVLVTEFYHHGEIAEDGKNVAVATTRNPKFLPTRVLELGPGDYCRLAFQTIEGQKSYQVLYGGDGPEKGAVPPWTNEDGLVMETRLYKECNFNSLDSVRAAFDSSTRIGSDYVPSVLHAGNPFSLGRQPFLSHYTGTLRLAAGGKFGFFTSSQDCSFLLIDGGMVADSPGHHGPAYVAYPGIRKEISLSAGPHKLEYYHAAGGPDSITALAWEVSPGSKPKPAGIPSENFRAQLVGRAAANAVSMRTSKLVPDFEPYLLGSVPLPDNDMPLVGVKFKDVSGKGLLGKGHYVWEFGDGQTSESSSPEHVYLHPGLYTVKFTIRHQGRPLTTTNRVGVAEPKLVNPPKVHTLDDYLPILEKYDPHTLDATALCQLALAFEAKADTYQPRNPDDPPDPQRPAPKRHRKRASEDDAPPAATSGEETPEERAEARTAMFNWYANVVNVGKVAFLEESAAEGDQVLMRLARLVAPIARDINADSSLAYKIWQGAAKRVKHPQLRSECALEAADIAINDMADARLGKKLLDAATLWGKEKPPEPKPAAGSQDAAKAQGFFDDVKPYEPQHIGGQPVSRPLRIWGDYYAAAADGKLARESYRQAEKLVAATRSQVEQSAWRGAYSRSTEQFLKTGELDRAIAEIRRWQDDFPAEKIEGQVTLMYARYFAARESYYQAIALADQLMNLAPDSPYIDQMLLFAAKCEVKRGKLDRAIPALQDLTRKYPGSPLVPEAKELLAKCQSGQIDTSAKTGPRPPRRREAKEGKG